MEQERMLVALSIVVDHSLGQSLHGLRAEVNRAQASEAEARKELFWSRVTSAWDSLLRSFKRRQNLCNCRSCEFLGSGYVLGTVANLDREIQAARNSCVFLEHFETVVNFVQDFSGGLLTGCLQFRAGASQVIVWDLDLEDLAPDSDETKALMSLQVILQNGIWPDDPAFDDTRAMMTQSFA